MPETKTPVKTKPVINPSPEPVRRYDPIPDHCPSQIERTIRRIRQI